VLLGGLLEREEDAAAWWEAAGEEVGLC